MRYEVQHCSYGIVAVDAESPEDALFLGSKELETGWAGGHPPTSFTPFSGNLYQEENPESLGWERYTDNHSLIWAVRPLEKKPKKRNYEVVWCGGESVIVSAKSRLEALKTAADYAEKKHLGWNKCLSDYKISTKKEFPYTHEYPKSEGWFLYQATLEVYKFSNWFAIRLAAKDAVPVNAMEEWEAAWFGDEPFRFMVPAGEGWEKYLEAEAESRKYHTPTSGGWKWRPYSKEYPHISLSGGQYKEGDWSLWSSTTGDWIVRKVDAEPKPVPVVLGPLSADGLQEWAIFCPSLHTPQLFRIPGIDPMRELHQKVVENWREHHKERTELRLMKESLSPIKWEKGRSSFDHSSSGPLRHFIEFIASNASGEEAGGYQYQALCMEPVPDGAVSTQKARGIAALGPMTLPYRVYRAAEAVPANLVGRFSRPCPMTPRHGFVDSRVPGSLTEAHALIHETRKADPEAEIITMPLVKAAFSGIWTPGILTIGPGTDGATQGRNAITIPSLGGWFPWLKGKKEGEERHKEVLEAAGITEAPYVELLWGAKAEIPIPVQVRNGPALPVAVNYIPKEITVQKIILAEGDLLEWETRMKAVDAGTVVYHPGGSLASHYAVHCVLNHVPVIVDHEPKVGEKLKAGEKTPKCDLMQLRAGFMAAQYMSLPMPTAVRLMMTATHHIPAWKGRMDFLLGLGMGCAFRLSIIAGLGEYRHINRSKKPPRNIVYSEHWGKSLYPDTAGKVAVALESFSDPSVEIWKGGSYGGMKWYEFLAWAPRIHNYLLKGDARKALEALNKVTNAVHNGGWGFNKFVDKSEFDMTSLNPTWALIRVAPILYAALKKSLDAGKLERRLLRRREMPIPVPNPDSVVNEPVEEEDSELESPPAVKKVIDYPIHLPEHDLYIVQKLDEKQGWIPTAWTSEMFLYAAVNLERAAASLKKAQKMWPSITYRLCKVWDAELKQKFDGYGEPPVKTSKEFAEESLKFLKMIAEEKKDVEAERQTVLEEEEIPF